jgi:cation diffusion facilitator CzcD-associated flavoprotein CzcO
MTPVSALQPKPAADGAAGLLPDHVHIAVVGAGFGGLGTAIRLQEEGITDFVILEKDPGVGGTWWANSYPGCTCDVPSRLYSLSFAPNPNWPDSFSSQADILAYLEDLAERHGLMPHIHLNAELVGGEWDDSARVWRLETAKGRLRADVLISASGLLSAPRVPDVPGLERFRGTVFHSARWDHEHDLRGERVAVVGTGASAIQFIPRIQPQAERLTVFQRTPPWILPHPGRPTSRLERKLYERLPALDRAIRAGIYWARETLVLGFSVDERFMALPERLARRHLERQVPDPELRAKLTPSYRFGCKRVLISNDYLPALQRPNVELVTHGVIEAREGSLVAADGSEHEIDTVILGTGFDTQDPPIAHRLRGRDGRTLSEVWREAGMRAHHGTSVAGFPNHFMLLGPNTGIGHTSAVFMIERQIEYTLQALGTLARGRAAAIEVRREVQERFNDELQERLEDTVWTQGGCQSWYLDPHGRNTTLWPTFTFDYARRLRRFEPAEHVLLEPAAQAEAA